MAPVITTAIVLHVFDYLESSRIIRLLTRESGIQSALAKGARRSRGRHGSALDLFAEGEIQLYIKTGRELQTLAAFDVTQSRTPLALDFDRFLAASALSELVLRIGREEQNVALYDTVQAAFDRLMECEGETAVAEAGIAAAWRILAASGFAPALDDCAQCHTPHAADSAVVFSHPAGGALCAQCARFASANRPLPAEARAILRGWLHGGEGHAPANLSTRDVRAHQRLLREFLTEHLADERPLRAYAAWEYRG